MLHDHLSSILKQKIQILALVQDNDGNFSWSPCRNCWAAVDLNTRTNLFSSIGIGARGAVITIRPDFNLTLHHAIKWEGQFLFLTSIILNPERDRQTIQAALVEISQCRDEYTGVSFPGIVTEKYLGHQQLEPQAINTLRHVLVTPKAISLTPGRLVEVDGVAWPIQVAHTLDPWKNEYEIERTVDL